MILGIIAFIVIMLHFSVTAYVKASKENVDIRIKYLWFDIYPRKPKPKKNRRRKKENKKENAEHFEDKPLENDFSPPEIPIEELMKLEVEEVQTDEDENLITQAEEKSDSADKEQLALIGEDEPAEMTGEGDKNASEEKAEQDVNSINENPEDKNIPDEEDNNNKDEPPMEKKSSRLDDLKSKYKMIKPYIPMGWKYFKKLLKTIRIVDLKMNVTVGKEDAYEAAMFYGKIQGVVFSMLAVISGILTVKIKEANVNCVFNEKIFDAEGETKIKIRPSALIAIAFCIAVSFLKIWLPKVIAKRKKRRAAQKTKIKNETQLGGRAA